MNRERLLLVSVLAVLALWFLVLYEAPQPTTSAKPGARAVTVLPVKSVSFQATRLDVKDSFTQQVREQPHPRPVLGMPVGRDLPNFWPPTSRSLSLKRLGMLRRSAPQPAEGEATVELPTDEANAGAGDGGTAVKERVDQWESFGRVTKGQIRGFVMKNGARVRLPGKLPGVGKVPDEFRTLIMLEVDPGAVEDEIAQVEVKFAQGGTVRQDFPGEISNFRIAVDGKQKGWFIGAKAYARLPAGGYDRRKTVGRKLLEEAVNSGDRIVLEWSLMVLNEARKNVPAAAQDILREILLYMLDAANRLNRQEAVLALGFEHLSRFPKENEVLIYIGNILSSRSFGLLEQAATCYQRAQGSKDAQRRRAALLIRLGRFAESRKVLESGLAGAGAEVDLLLARVALAQADFEVANTRASAHTGSRQDQAEAYQILGGVAYAKGDAAGAEGHFLNAVHADPKRSTAYSDLGLAFAAQGKGADAMVCFKRAMELDFENSVVPRIGEAFLKINAGDMAGARGVLEALEKDNPRDLLVRYFLAYTRERAGDLAGAANGYRSVLDDDHRYRVAIARLGLVQSRRVEQGDTGGADLQRPAIAHLTKAVDLNPNDAVLPYILARFMMGENIQRTVADSYFARTEKAPTPTSDMDLPLWAQAARAALLYRDDSIEGLAIMSRLNRVVSDVRDTIQRRGDPDDLKDLQRATERHPVYIYAKECLDAVTENSRKVDVVWEFKTKPRDWLFHSKSPMRVGVSGQKGAIHFQGRVDFKGQQRDFSNILDYCAVEYLDQKKLTGNSFYEVIIEGEIPDGCPVEVGVGLVGQASGGRRRASGRSGVQIKRKARTGNADVRLEGAEAELFKKMKARSFIEMTKVKWPTGKFTVRITIEEREKRRFSLTLNDQNVFLAQMDQETETALIFGRGRGSRGLSIVVWVEGNDGTRYENIYINKVTLTREKSGRSR